MQVTATRSREDAFSTPCGTTAVGSEYVNGEWVNVAEFNILTNEGKEVKAGEAIE